MERLKKLLKGDEVKKYFWNTSWMMGEKILTMGLAMVVSILVARHLGPEGYGILSYAISLASLFTVATHMGLSGLAVRELVSSPDQQEELLGTILSLKLLGALVAGGGFLILVFSIVEEYNVEFWVLLVVSGIIFLKPFEVFDFWFQAKVKAKYSSIVRGSASIILSITKIILVIVGAQVLAFAYAHLLQALIAVLLFVFFFKKIANISFKSWKFTIAHAKRLLGQGWMIMFGAIFAMVYLKIDQVMLRWLVSADEVGIYSVSAQLSEAWYFIPNVIVASIFPKLISLREKEEKQFKKRLQQLLDMLFAMALSLAVLVTVISGPLIDMLYGAEFERAATILSIHIWAGIFIFMRAAFSKWILIEDAISFSMITQGLGAVVNIILNILFIPYLAGLGAAIATIISYGVASYFSLFFYKKSRPIFWMMTKSLLSPYRYSIHFLKRN